MSCLLFLSLSLSGCRACGGPGTDAGTDADPGTDAGPGTDASADAASGVTIVSSDPADGAAHVALLADVVVTFSGPLDPATVNETTLVLEQEAPRRRYYGVVVYDDAARTITYTSYASFPTGAAMRLSLNGVLDAQGKAVSGTVAFRAARNPLIRRTFFDDITTLIMTDVVYEADADGLIIAERTYDDPGPDGIWLTGDETFSFYAETTYDANGDRATHVTWVGPGADGTWLNSDDEVWRRYEAMTTATGRAWVTYDGPGADGTWMTGDDNIYSAEVWVTDADGRDIAYGDFYDPGPDGVWLSPDDGAAFALAWLWDADGYLIRGTMADLPGTDGLWMTPDDELGWATESTRDWRGFPETTISYDGPGADGTWFNGDDHASDCETYQYDATGRTGIVADSAGADGACFTSDDAMSAFLAFTPFARDLVSYFGYFTSAGLDGTWGGADDEALYYENYELDPVTGTRMTLTRFDSAGLDGEWFTADDILSWWEGYDSAL